MKLLITIYNKIHSKPYTEVIPGMAYCFLTTGIIRENIKDIAILEKRKII